MLTDLDKEILAFERGWWAYRGAKDDAIDERFGVSAGHYYRTLNRLLDSSDALEHDPLLVKRLRRLRTARLARRRSA